MPRSCDGSKGPLLWVYLAVMKSAYPIALKLIPYLTSKIIDIHRDLCRGAN